MNFIKARKYLDKKSKKGFRGYPLATISFYGPTNKLATKVAVGIVQHEHADPVMARWRYTIADIRNNHQIMQEIMQFIKENEVLSVVMMDKIIGCSHEEGVDYPDGEVCEECTYWLNRDRFTGEVIH